MNSYGTLIEHSIKRRRFHWQKTGSDSFFNVLKLENHSVENYPWGKGVWVASRIILVIITGFDIFALI